MMKAFNKKIKKSIYHKIEKHLLIIIKLLLSLKVEMSEDKLFILNLNR